MNPKSEFLITCLPSVQRAKALAPASSSQQSSGFTNSRMRGFNVDTMTAAETAWCNGLFVNMLIHAGLAFAMVENPVTIAFFKALRPAWKMPSRKQVGPLAPSVFSNESV